MNDRVDVALASDADGVHIGQDDMPFAETRRILGPQAIIGLSVRNLVEVVEAEPLGVDYLGLGPVFPTGTKADAGAACGVGTITAVRAASSLPIVVIGGITLANVADTIRAGADCAAAISAVVAVENCGTAVREFMERTRAAKGQRPSELQMK